MKTDADTVLTGCGGILLALVTAAFFGGCYGCSKWEVSDGYRDGTVRKLSHTGYVWKTWEVEMVGDVLIVRDSSAGAVAGPEKFTYSVSDGEVVKKIQALPPGRRVRVHYKKYGAAWEPAGESRYFITSVEELTDTPK